MSEPILPFVTTDNVGKDEATVVKVDGREIKKNPIDVGQDGLRILQIIAGVISASTQTLGSNIKHIFLQNGKLTVSTANVGTNKKPVYLNNGEVKASDANIGSSTQSVYMEGGELKASDANVGSGNKPVYMEDGELKASGANVGSNTKPVYMEGGAIKASTASKGSNIKPIYLENGAIVESDANVGQDGLHVLKMVDGELQVSASSKGSNIKPIYLENGAIKESTANVGQDGLHVLKMVDGELKASDASKGSNVKPIYLNGGAIEESNANVGQDGLHLIKMVDGELQVSTSSKGSNIKFVYVQNGEVKETSVTLGSNIKHVYLQDGELKASDSSVGGKIEVYDETTDENPEIGKHYFKREEDDTYTDITSELSVDDNLQEMDYTVFELKETKFAPAVLKGGNIAVDDANVGSNACFLYMQNGELKASTLTAGTNAKLLKIVNGEIKESNDNVGSGIKPIYLSNGQITASAESIGSGTQPVYMEDGELKASTASKGSSIKHIYLENGEVKESNVNVGQDGLHLIKIVNGEIQVSTGSKGSSAKPIYLENGEVKESSANVGQDGLHVLKMVSGEIQASNESKGSSTKPIYLSNGALEESNANVGQDGLHVLKMVSGELQVSTGSKGSNIKPIYLSNGAIEESTANVGQDGLHVLKMVSGELQVSGESKGSSAKPIYLNSGAIEESNANIGQDGLHLIKMVSGELQVSTGSKGSNIKFTYLENGEIKETSLTLGSGIKHVYLQEGELKASDSSVGGRKDVWTISSDTTPQAGKRYAYLIDDVYTEIVDPEPGVEFSGEVYEFESKFELIHLKDGETVADPNANVGSDACFIYLKDGELRASALSINDAGQLIKIVKGSIEKDTSSNIGGEGKLVKIVNGKIVEDTSATVGDGTTLVFLSNGQLTASAQSVGDDTRPVKLSNGMIVQVAGELATKVAPALERSNEPRTINNAERQVPTTPTPSPEDPGTMVANKEYVDSFMSSNATYGYGVVDGSICTDAGDNPCVTSFDVGTTLTEITYTTSNDCYLYIHVEGLADIYSGESSPALDIQINGQSIGRLLDHMDDTYATRLYDRPACGIPVAKGSIVRIANVDEGVPMFSTWGTGAALVITEYRLASISPTIEMPKYDRNESFDIHVAAFSENGYVAPRRGYLLASIFDERGIYVPSNKSMKIYINDILVMNGRNIIKQVLTDSKLKHPELIGTDEGSVRDMLVTAGATMTLEHPSSYKVYKRYVSPVTGQYEYDLVLNPGTLTDSTLTFNESLVDTSVVVVDGARHIEDIELTDTGCCLIPVNYHDVIKIRTSEGNVDYSGNASTWPSNVVYSVTSDTTPDLSKRYYKATDGGMVEVTDEVRAASDMTAMGYIVYEGVYVDANHDGSIDATEHRWQALFLRTRQTGANTEPEELNRDDFVMGGFMDGTVFQDDRGNELITEVPYTTWALTQDADNLYTYKYIVKKDCMLYMSFLVNAKSDAGDKVKITINGKEFDYFFDNDHDVANVFSDTEKQLMLPMAAGTVIGFHSKFAPTHNMYGSADSSGTYAIKIKEYKLIASGETADVSNIRVGGGVIDGTVSNVSEVDLTVVGNNKPTYTYKTTKDCLLLIEVNKAVISSSAIQVQVGSTTVGYLSDNESTDTDNDSMRIPVRANTDIVLVGDGTNNIFSSTPEGSVLRFTELKLTALAKQVGMPDYDSGVDITGEVTRTSISESRGYKAPSEGYVLFQSLLLTGDCVVNGSINDHVVYVSGYRTGTGGDYFNNCGMTPVREGDIIDFRITSVDGSSLVVQTGPKVFFFPLKTVGEINVGCVELPIIEHPFDSAVDNPFLDYTKIDKTKLSFTSDTLRKMGYDIDVAKADIKTKIDVFYPRYDVLGNLMKDANGHVMVDTNKPMFRFEPMVYDQTAGGYGADDVPFSVQRTGVGASTALICWPTLGVTPNVRMLLRGFNAFKTNVPTPEIDPDIRPTHHMVTGIDTTDLTYMPGVADWAATRGFTGYYIRLTAVVDPRSPNVKVSKSGMFIDGQINVDDNGQACKTLVTYDKWAANGNVTDGYTYEYIVKTDCLLYMNVGLEINNSTQEEVVIKINGETLDAYTDTGMSTSGQLIDLNKILALPLSRGTKVSFYTKTTPVHNQRTAGGALPGGEDFIIKLIEFKMSTELNPAQFPSLSVRVFDIQNSSAEDKAEFLNRHYTWTEDQLKQVFGSMFSLDEAKIDFRAVFYTGDAITAYDTTTNKVEDPFVEITDNGANHVHKLSAVVLDNDGTKTLDVMIPQLPYFVSGVTWDSVNGKVVLRNQRTGIGGDLAVAAGVRMRLLMHISDRRGEKGDSYPNGISSTSKMVRQGDMNLIATTSGATRTYSNEITITESGWCQIHANFDEDGSVLDSAGHQIAVVEAFVGGAWISVAKLAGTVSSGNGSGEWQFTFPVEANTKLRMATNFKFNGTALTEFYKNTDLPFTRRGQALCWVIPTSKYLTPEQNLAGSAGVIDGSIWKRADGTDEVTVFSEVNGNLLTTQKTLTYNVKNDCLLSITADGNIGLGVQVGDAISVSVNGVVVDRIIQYNDSPNSPLPAGCPDNSAVAIPVARGSVITLQCTTDNPIAPYQPDAQSHLTFTEFKLRATNVVAAMPDWDTDKKVSLSSGDIVPADGWLRIAYDLNGTSDNWTYIRINGITVSAVHGLYAGEDLDAPIPVSKGDVVTVEYASSSSIPVTSIDLYPVKMTEHVYPTKMIVPNWSGNGESLATGDAAPADGFVVIKGGGISSLSVNGIQVSRGGNTTYGIDHYDIIPVAKNDIITYSADNPQYENKSVKFYYAKPETSLPSDVNVLEQKVNANIASILALESNLRYPFVSITNTVNEQSKIEAWKALTDRAVNVLQADNLNYSAVNSGNTQKVTTMRLPKFTSGRARDFYLVVKTDSIGADGEHRLRLVFQSPKGSSAGTFSEIVYLFSDDENQALVEHSNGNPISSTNAPSYALEIDLDSVYEIHLHEVTQSEMGIDLPTLPSGIENISWMRVSVKKLQGASSKTSEIVLVDAESTDGIFDMVADMMSNAGVSPSNNNYNAGKFALPTTLTDAKYATIVQFMQGVTEKQLVDMTGNNSINLSNTSIEFKLVTYRGSSADAYATAEKYEEINPMVLVGGGTGPRAFVGVLRAIINRNNGVTSIRVPWPGSFMTNSASHWSTPSSGSTPKFYPSDFCTVQQLGEDSTNKYYGGSDLRARVVMILKRG